MFVVYPGQTITLPAVVVGQDFGTTTGVVIAQFLKSKPYTTCSVDLEPEQTSRTVTHNGTCSSLPFTIYSNSEDCETVLVLKTDNREVLKPMTTHDNNKIKNSWAILTQEPNYVKLASQLISQFVTCDIKQIDSILTDSYTKVAGDTIENFLKFTSETIERISNISECSDIKIETLRNKLIFPKEIYNYPVYVAITFDSCPLGFSVTALAPYKCDCIETLHTVGNVECFIQDQTITREGLVWVGTHNSNTTVAAAKYCPFNYCKTMQVRFSLQQNDTHMTQDQQCI